MISYITMYLIPSIISISSLRKKKYLWYLTAIIFIFIMGLRYEVGGDWENYLFHINFEIPKLSLQEVLYHSDPGYYLLTYIMIHLDLGIYGINTIIAMIFMLGLIRFIKQQYNPWLSFSVSIPYLLIVVAMGYTRQAAAIGFVMLALSFLYEKKFFKFLFLVVIASTFHKSAVLMIGIGLFTNSINLYLRILAIILIGVGIYEAFLSNYQEGLWRGYVEANMQSQGAKIRVIMNLLPSILLLLFRKRWKLYYNDYNLWRFIALLSIGSFFIVDIASTAVDRVALYFIIIQLVVFGRLPLLTSHLIKPKYMSMLILSYYFMVLLVWLLFASHAYCWLPYQNIIFHNLI